MARLAPIALFVFNRPEHTRQTLAHLAACQQATASELFIFSDGPRTADDEGAIAEVRALCTQQEGFAAKHLVYHPDNMGLAQNILSGVSQLMEAYGRVIVLEDDLITAPGFLAYMNAALDFYESRQEVFSISGYNHPPSLMPIPPDYHADVFYNYRNSSWGWASWQDRWEQVDWEMRDYPAFARSRIQQRAFNRGGEDLSDILKAQMAGRLNSWAIRFSFAHFRHDALSVYPVRSLVQNIGHDGSGTHSLIEDRYRNDLSKCPSQYHFPANIWVDPRIMAAFRRVYRYSWQHRAKMQVKTWLNIE